MSKPFIIEVDATRERIRHLPDLRLNHLGCGHLSITRDLLGLRYVLSCQNCKTSIHLDRVGRAEGGIMLSAASPGIGHDISGYVTIGPPVCLVVGVDTGPALQLTS